MSRRLISRSGGTVTAATALPEYEKPSCVLGEDGRRAINNLSNERNNAVYSQNITASLRFIGSSVGDIHERLREQREKLEAMRTRRQEKGMEKTEEEQRLEDHVAELGPRVDALTDSSEKAVRDLIDRMAELEDEAGILEYCYNNTAADSEEMRRWRQENRQDDEEDEIKPPLAPSVLEMYQRQLSSRESEYTALSMRQRYALNNQYVAFKKLWHDSMAGEDGPPLPDSSRWFRPDGQPVMSGIGNGADGADEDEDDDIAVSREVLSINCPLSLMPMQEPYSNRKCKHTFEKSAIIEYLPISGAGVQCPQTGCSEKFSRTQFDHDFYLDQAMIRRIKRARQAQEQQDMEDDEEEEEAEDSTQAEVRVRGQKPAPGRVVKREMRGN